MYNITVNFASDSVVVDLSNIANMVSDRSTGVVTILFLILAFLNFFESANGSPFHQATFIPENVQSVTSPTTQTLNHWRIPVSPKTYLSSHSLGLGFGAPATRSIFPPPAIMRSASVIPIVHIPVRPVGAPPTALSTILTEMLAKNQPFKLPTDEGKAKQDLKRFLQPGGFSYRA